MVLKWHPIIDGDLSGIPRDEELLFTVFNPTDGNYVVSCWIEEYFEGNLEVTNGLNYYEAKDVKAWMDFPPPFTPNDCNRCAHFRVWVDGFGDRWSKCELWNEPFAMVDCPLR